MGYGFQGEVPSCSALPFNSESAFSLRFPRKTANSGERADRLLKVTWASVLELRPVTITSSEVFPMWLFPQFLLKVCREDCIGNKGRCHGPLSHLFCTNRI